MIQQKPILNQRLRTRLSPCASYDPLSPSNTGATVDTPGEDIQQDFQTSLDRWAGALHVTGGELDPKKSWCYFIDFQWTGTAWQYRSKDDMPGDFTINDKDGIAYIKTTRA